MSVLPGRSYDYLRHRDAKQPMKLALLCALALVMAGLCLFVVGMGVGRYLEGFEQ